MSKRTTTANIDEKQEAAIALTVSGKTQREVAIAIDVEEATVNLWQDDAVYIAALNTARMRHWEATQDKLREARLKAIDALLTAIDSEDEKISVNAAQALLRVALNAPTGPMTQTAVERMRLFDF